MELSKIRKVFAVPMTNRDAEEKINLMLKAGWQILNSYKQTAEIAPYQYSESLIFVLGHVDANATVPTTDYENQLNQYSGVDIFPED